MNFLRHATIALLVAAAVMFLASAALVIHPVNSVLEALGAMLCLALARGVSSKSFFY